MPDTCELLKSGDLFKIVQPFAKGEFGKKELFALFSPTGKILSSFLGDEDFEITRYAIAESDNIDVHTHPESELELLREATVEEAFPISQLSVQDIVSAFKTKNRACAIGKHRGKIIIDCVDGRKVDIDKIMEYVDISSGGVAQEGNILLITPEQSKKMLDIRRRLQQEAGCRLISDATEYYPTAQGYPRCKPTKED